MSLNSQIRLEILLREVRPNILQIPGWTTDFLDVDNHIVYPIFGMSGGISTALIFYVITWNDAHTEGWSIPIEVGRFTVMNKNWLACIIARASELVHDPNCPDRRPVSFAGGDMGRATPLWRFGLNG